MIGFWKETQIKTHPSLTIARIYATSMTLGGISIDICQAVVKFIVFPISMDGVYYEQPILWRDLCFIYLKKEYLHELLRILHAVFFY